MGGGTECTAIDLRQSEGGAVAGDDDIGVAHQSDATAQAEAMHCCNDRNCTLIDRGKRLKASPFGPDQRGEPRRALHLLDVDPGVEATSLCAQDCDANGGVFRDAPKDAREVQPALHMQCVDRRSVEHHLGNAVGDGAVNAHDRSRIGARIEHVSVFFSCQTLPRSLAELQSPDGLMQV